jgi:hypothetical protein
MDSVIKGQVLGRIVAEKTEEKLVSPVNGIICEKAGTEVTAAIAGRTLFGIGELI